MIRPAKALTRSPLRACFWSKTCDISSSSSSGCLMMRGVLTAFLFLALVQSASAQGTKDRANTTSSSIITTPEKKKQTTQAASRPTAVRNVTGSLPAGRAAQGVWRDGKLIAVPR